MSARSYSTIGTLLLALLLTGCANHHFRVVDAAAATKTPRYLELRSEVSVATLHFPRGRYSLYAVDDIGYYYRAPRKIIEHTASWPVAREGGIFVSKRNPRKLRGYVFWTGALTHVGNLSRSKHEFHD